jgi:hypothetical protein
MFDRCNLNNKTNLKKEIPTDFIVVIMMSSMQVHVMGNKERQKETLEIKNVEQKQPDYSRQY